MKSRCARRGSRFATMGVLAMDLGFACRGFAAMGLGFARCGSFFYGGLCSQSCSSVVVVAVMGCGQGLCSRWVLGMWYGLVSSSMVHGVGHDGSRCGCGMGWFQVRWFMV